MSPLLLIVFSIIGTLLAERLWNLPRDIRRNDERIKNRDEDLRAWIEDDDAELRQQHLAVMAREARGSEGSDFSLVEYQRLKDQVAHRYRDQLRDAERTARDVALSEQLPHHFARGLLHRPLPELTAPVVKAATIQHWYESPQELYEFSEKLREVAEQRRAEAGKPPLRPYEHPGRVRLIAGLSLPTRPAIPTPRS